MSSDTSTKASPINIRPLWRSFGCFAFKKMLIPTSSSNGTSHSARTSRICVTMAEPKSAPRKIASPTAALSPPLLAKLATSTATAVELCSNIAATTPLPAAKVTCSALRRSQMRSWFL